MRNKSLVMLLIFSLFLGFIGISGCKTKEGCEITEKYQPKVDKNGELSKKRGKSNLFSKKSRKKKK